MIYCLQVKTISVYLQVIALVHIYGKKFEFTELKGTIETWYR